VQKYDVIVPLTSIYFNKIILSDICNKIWNCLYIFTSPCSSWLLTLIVVYSSMLWIYEIKRYKTVLNNDQYFFVTYLDSFVIFAIHVVRNKGEDATLYYIILIIIIMFSYGTPWHWCRLYPEPALNRERSKRTHPNADVRPLVKENNNICHFIWLVDTVNESFVACLEQICQATNKLSETRYTSSAILFHLINTCPVFWGHDILLIAVLRHQSQE